jgi:hypothetical protein
MFPIQIHFNVLASVPDNAVLAGEASTLLSSSTTVFTTTSIVPTFINGKLTTTNIVLTGSSVTLVPIQTTTPTPSSISSNE